MDPRRLNSSIIELGPDAAPSPTSTVSSGSQSDNAASSPALPFSPTFLAEIDAEINTIFNGAITPSSTNPRIDTTPLEEFFAISPNTSSHTPVQPRAASSMSTRIVSPVAPLLNNIASPRTLPFSPTFLARTESDINAIFDRAIAPSSTNPHIDKTPLQEFFAVAPNPTPKHQVALPAIILKADEVKRGAALDKAKDNNAALAASAYGQRQKRKGAAEGGRRDSDKKNDGNKKAKVAVTPVSLFRNPTFKLALGKSTNYVSRSFRHSGF